MKKLFPILLLVLTIFSCKTPDARRPVSQATDTFIDRSIENNKKLVAKEEQRIQKIIQKDTAHNYITSKNGFWYFYNKKNIQDTLTPDFGDKVVFDYNIHHLDGTPIYTTQEIDTRTYIMDKENIFTGLREGLKLMKEGETITFLFPSHKAFGYYGDQQKIGVNVPIKSTVTVKSIQPDFKINSDTLIETQP